MREIFSIISAGWSMASIPIYGEIRLVEKVKDAIKLANDARKVISVFADFLVMVRDYLGSRRALLHLRVAAPPPAVGCRARRARAGRRGAALRDLRRTVAATRCRLARVRGEPDDHAGGARGAPGPRPQWGPRTRMEALARKRAVRRDDLAGGLRGGLARRRPAPRPPRPDARRAPRRRTPGRWRPTRSSTRALRTRGWGDREVTAPRRPSGAVAQVGAGVASLVEAWLRDAATYAVVLLSLVHGAGRFGRRSAAVGRRRPRSDRAPPWRPSIPTIRRWRPRTDLAGPGRRGGPGRGAWCCWGPGDGSGRPPGVEV